MKYTGVSVHPSLLLGDRLLLSLTFDLVGLSLWDHLDSLCAFLTAGDVFMCLTSPLFICLAFVQAFQFWFHYYYLSHPPALGICPATLVSPILDSVF